MSVTIYHNPRCSKSRATLALLEEKGIAPEIVEYLRTPPSKEEMNRILDGLGMAPRDLALGLVRVALQQPFGDHQAEHPVAKKFQALVGGGGALLHIGIAGMAQGL